MTPVYNNITPEYNRYVTPVYNISVEVHLATRKLKDRIQISCSFVRTAGGQLQNIREWTCVMALVYVWDYVERICVTTLL